MNESFVDPQKIKLNASTLEIAAIIIQTIIRLNVYY